MARLITFGCSFTYGQSMPDCVEKGNVYNPGPKPSKFAWPNVLSKMLNIECINQSNCGASNLEILYKILDFNFEKDDVIVIMWSLPERDIYFTRLMKSYRKLGAWMTDKIAKKWMLTLDEYDYIQRSWIYMHHADLYLKNLDVKYMHYPAYADKLTVESSLKNISINNLYLDGQVNCDLALDNSHPGIESHKQTANNIFNILDKNILNES